MRLDIRTATGIDVEALTQFYRDTYPSRLLEQMWRWLYRTSFPNSPFPLVVQEQARIVAHAGGIPFEARLDGRLYRGAWFVDFAIRPDLQRKGIGTQLAVAWMEPSDLCVTFCNELSMGVFRKLGWLEGTVPGIHRLWLKPFEHPKLSRVLPGPLKQAAAVVPERVLKTFYAQSAGAEVALVPLDNAEAIGIIRDAMGASSDAPTGAVEPRRDSEYVAWRIERSPHRDSYRLFREGEVVMLVRLADRPERRIDVLWCSSTQDPKHTALRRMLASLAVWGLGQQYAHIRYLVPSREAADALRALRPQVTHPTFAYWTRQAGLRERLASATWRWHLIDSDFEWI
jgi:hypothetical protein